MYKSYVSYGNRIKNVKCVLFVHIKMFHTTIYVHTRLKKCMKFPPKFMKFRNKLFIKKCEKYEKATENS